MLRLFRLGKNKRVDNTFLDSYGRICSDRPLEEVLQGLIQNKEAVLRLDLSDWELPVLPTVLLAFDKLQELYFDRNGLVSLPDWISAFQELRVLSLGRNKLIELPKSLLHLNCLEKLFLGHNQIAELPFPEYELVMLKQGSIGRNPLREMISRRWMLWDDIIQFPSRIQQLVPENLPREFEKLFSEQAARIIIDCQDPMIYEILLEGVSCDEHGVQWTEYFRRPCFRWIGEQMLEHIPRGTILDDSLLCFVYR